MPWPPKVLSQFAQVPNAPSESDFHGPYNKLLYTLFPSDTDFTVVPQYLPGSRESADFIVMFEVLLKNKPVFVLELKKPGNLQWDSTREAADLQMRSRLRDLARYCPLPALRGVCAMGTRLCFYKISNGITDPPQIQAHPQLATDTAPEERWNYEILEEEGEQKFRGVVEEIKQACEAL